MGRLALVGRRSGHVGDVLQLVIPLLCGVVAAEDLGQLDAGCLDGL